MRKVVEFCETLDAILKRDGKDAPSHRDVAVCFRMVHGDKTEPGAVFDLLGFLYTAAAIVKKLFPEKDLELHEAAAAITEYAKIKTAHYNKAKLTIIISHEHTTLTTTNFAYAENEIIEYLREVAERIGSDDTTSFTSDGKRVTRPGDESEH